MLIWLALLVYLAGLLALGSAVQRYATAPQRQRYFTRPLRGVPWFRQGPVPQPIRRGYLRLMAALAAWTILGIAALMAIRASGA